MEVHPSMLVPLVAVTNLIVGVAIGKMHERVEWNNLIKQGKVPVPVKKRSSKHG